MFATFSSSPYGSVVQFCNTQPQPRYWIEIELLAEDNSPIAQEECWLIAEGQEPVKGFLDDQGFARIADIPQPREYAVAFPGVDKQAVWFEKEAEAKALSPEKLGNLKLRSRSRKIPLQGEVHPVDEAQSVDSLAYEYGHLSTTIWDHPNNKDLRQVRGDNRILAPKDPLFIPPLDPPLFPGRKTDLRHVFRRKGVVSWLRFRPLGLCGGGLAQKFGIFRNGSFVARGDAQGGDVVWPLEPNAEELTVLAEFEGFRRLYRVYPRGLDPIGTTRGVQQRLACLGFYAGETSGDLDGATVAAIGSFKMWHGLASEQGLSNKLLDALYRASGNSPS